VTSGSPSPTLGKNIALVMCRMSFSAVGAILYVEIRGQKCKAQVVVTPFTSGRRKHRHQKRRRRPETKQRSIRENLPLLFYCVRLPHSRSRPECTGLTAQQKPGKRLLRSARQAAGAKSQQASIRLRKRPSANS